ncbi:cytochrome P450 3A11-like [Macrosteles quadrilineatus]|uniref:cytochrome P450 3A11-like n=1 Tax=Macrosteles quadrilineatus TaxID=74068 RepID=UPI0023E0EC3B|nr:cytochrome P450 3A11-like [Macrosteles quadrilineatus]
MAVLDPSVCVCAIFAALAVGIAFFYRWITSKHDYFLKQGINGPTPTIPTGSWRRAWKLQAGEEDLARLKRYGKVHGTFDGPIPNLIIAEPQLIRQVLHEQSSKYRSRRAYRVKNQILHKSLLAIEGTEPKSIKEVTNAALSSENIKKLVPRMNKAVDTFTQLIIRESKADAKVNVSKCVIEYLSDALAFTMFGLDLNADEKLKKQFNMTINCAFAVVNPKSAFSISPFLFESLGTLDDFVLRKDCLGFLSDLCYSVLKQRRSQEVSTEGKAVDFLDLLLSAAEEEKKQAVKNKGVDEKEVELLLTDMEIVSQCVSVVLTVAQLSRSSLALSLYTLGSLPSIQDRLRNEVENLLQKHSASTYELVQECEYLDMFLGEILRLYPLEYRLERECVENTTLGEAKVEQGTLVSVPIYAIHRLEEYYPDPETFQPERFSPENASKRDHSIYLPFGQAGTNSSNIGIRMGVLLTKLAVAVLVSAFQMSSVEGAKVPATLQNGFTVIPQPEELWVKATVK